MPITLSLSSIFRFGSADGLYKQLSAEKAIADEVTFRSIERTIDDEIVWFNKNSRRSITWESASDYSGIPRKRIGAFKNGKIKKLKIVMVAVLTSKPQ